MSAAVVAAALRERQSFILTSHARPDGDAIGSQLSLALALRALRKDVRLINRDPIPAQYRHFPGIGDIEFAAQATGQADAVVTLECSDITRPGVAGLDRYFVVNVDHHLGNEMYGAVNWFDPSAASCTEMVADVIDELGVPWTQEIAKHLYLGIATDTGGFRHGPISARTFDVCRRIAETGVEPAAMAREIFDSFGIGRVKLTGEMLSRMELHHGGRLADVLLTCSYLPAFTRRMLTAGEDAAELPKMCTVVARHYDREVAHLTKTVTTVIEPILIVGLAGVVLLIALAIFLPMWNMTALLV